MGGNGRPRLIKNSMPSSRPRSINRSSFTHRQPATDPPTSWPTYPRDREVPLACLVGELYVRVRYRGLRCVVGVYPTLPSPAPLPPCAFRFLNNPSSG